MKELCFVWKKTSKKTKTKKANQNKNTIFLLTPCLFKNILENRTFGKIYTCLNLGSVLLYSAFLYHTLFIDISFCSKPMWQADAFLTL